jgi:hypothetical protein
MLKHHKIISFCAGLIFLIVLQKFATPVPIFRFLLPAFLVYAAALATYNYYYLKQLDKYNFWTVLRSVMLLLSLFGVFLVLPTANLRGLMLIVSVVLIIFFEILISSAAENILLVETLLIAFGLFCTAFGFYFDAPGYGPYYLLVVFFSAFLLARSFFEFVPKPDKVKLVSAIAIGLFCSELYWVLNFLQFHFSVLALILFNIFYFSLIASYYQFYHILNFKKIKFHLFLMSACVVVVLITTPWNIIQ